MPEETQYQPNVYLVGFMGTGKSAVGRGFARRSGMRFIDSDREIERQDGRRIREIFEADGEAHFRQLERAFVESGHPEGGCVVSCGGGLILQDGMIDLLKKKGVLICLFASVDTILKRTLGNDKRPLLNVEDPEKRIRELMEKRTPLYLRAGTGLTTENRSISEVVSNLDRIYRRESARFKKRQRKLRAIGASTG